MRQRLRPRLTYANVISTLALFLVLGGVSYAATGGNFILGQSNSAGAPTKLSSPTTNAAGALKVTNTSTTNPGRGISAVGGSGGFGLWASGGLASANTAAIHGQSAGSNAVEGISGKDTASGVYGQNDSTGYGVAGRSTNGIGVLGDSSSGWALAASGNATQTRTGNGFVKAMAYVDPVGHPSDPIQQCFNSQLSPSQATSGNCGIATFTSPGFQDLDFGFRVDDRFVSATESGRGDRIVSVKPAGANVLEVSEWAPSENKFATTPVDIVVY
jgi:hypothetical protein